jgi:hypothetical protein
MPNRPQLVIARPPGPPATVIGTYPGCAVNGLRRTADGKTDLERVSGERREVWCS